MTRYEESAGGVIFRKTSQGFEILMLKDQKGNWTFPKGLIEKGEEKEEAAQREISEEVGLNNVRFIQEIDKVKYFYKWENDLVKKTVHFFLFEFFGDETPVPQEEEGIQEVQWFSKDDALASLGYKKSNLPILNKALEAIKI